MVSLSEDNNHSITLTSYDVIFSPGFEGDFCQFPKGTVKSGTPVTWSAMEQCQMKKDNAAHNTVVESVEFIEEEIEESEAKTKGHKNKSNTTAVLSSLLVISIVVGIAGFAYLKRDQREREEHEYDADAVWPPPGSNLAPMGRTWTYPASGDSNPSHWEYSNQHGTLHDVVIN